MENEKKISYSSIYRRVWASLFPGVKLTTHFRQKGKPYSHQKKSYTQYFDSSIHDREEIANQRMRLRDFEGETIYGSVGKGYLVTGVDRMSSFLISTIAPDKTVESSNSAFMAAFIKAKAFQPITLTLDNKTEFLSFKELENALNIKVYFADTHAP